MTGSEPTPAENAVPDYDQVWDEVYGDLQDVGPVHRHMKRIMRRLLRPLEYSSVLEVGVGFGHNLPLLTDGRRLQRVAGIDFSERALEHVRSEWGDDFHNIDIERERLDARFELVCVPLVMEHVIDDEAVLRNLRAMTGRYLLIVTIAGDFERYRAWEDQMGHVRNYRRGELERKLRSTGFEVQHAIYWGFPFYSPIARRLQNGMQSTHELSRSSKLIAKLLYPVYFINSSRRGDLLIVLARAA